MILKTQPARSLEDLWAHRRRKTRQGPGAQQINLQHRVWFNSLPLQRFQELLILFSKPLTSFLHNTCSLSVLCMCLALDGIYHPLNAPLPRSATHGSSPYAHACDTRTGALTRCNALFQENLISRLCWQSNSRLQFETRAPISMVSSSRFIRHY